MFQQPTPKKPRDIIPIRQSKEIDALLTGVAKATGKSLGWSTLFRLGLRLIILHYASGKTWSADDEAKVQAYLEKNLGDLLGLNN